MRTIFVVRLASIEDVVRRDAQRPTLPASMMYLRRSTIADRSEVLRQSSQAYPCVRPLMDEEGLNPGSKCIAPRLPCEYLARVRVNIPYAHLSQNLIYTTYPMGPLSQRRQLKNPPSRQCPQAQVRNM